MAIASDLDIQYHRQGSGHQCRDSRRYPLHGGAHYMASLVSEPGHRTMASLQVSESRSTGYSCNAVSEPEHRTMASLQLSESRSTEQWHRRNYLREDRGIGASVEELEHRIMTSLQRCLRAGAQTMTSCDSVSELGQKIMV